MELNSFLFPSPKMNWKPSKHIDELIFIPRNWDSTRQNQDVKVIRGSRHTNNCNPRFSSLRKALDRASKNNIIGMAKPTPDNPIDTSIDMGIDDGRKDASEFLLPNTRNPTSNYVFRGPSQTNIKTEAPGPRAYRNNLGLIDPSSSPSNPNAHLRLHETDLSSRGVTGSISKSLDPSANSSQIKKYFVINTQKVNPSLNQRLTDFKISINLPNMDRRGSLHQREKGTGANKELVNIENTINRISLNRKLSINRNIEKKENNIQNVSKGQYNIEFDTENCKEFDIEEGPKRQIPAISTISKHPLRSMISCSNRNNGTTNESKYAIDTENERKNTFDSKIDPYTIHKIPCLLIKPYNGSDSIILYFHANGEDISQASKLCRNISENVNVMSV